jgi:hypothetical protein
MRWRPDYFVLTEGQNVLLFPLNPAPDMGRVIVKGKNYGIGSPLSISVYEGQKESRIFFHVTARCEFHYRFLAVR